MFTYSQLTRNVCSGSCHISLSHTPLHLLHRCISVGRTCTLTCPTCIQTGRLDYRNRSTSLDLVGRGRSICVYIHIYIQWDQRCNSWGRFGYGDICNCRRWGHILVSRHISLSCEDTDICKNRNWNISAWGMTESFGSDSYMFGSQNTGMVDISVSLGIHTCRYRSWNAAPLCILVEGKGIHTCRCCSWISGFHSIL